MARPSVSRGALRAFVETFPPLKLALAINDCICFTIQQILEHVWLAIKFAFKQSYRLVKYIFSTLNDLRFKVPFLHSGSRKSVHYKRLDRQRPHQEPIPYRNKFLKRSLTYQGGLVLGALLYLFVYYVLIKHHTYTTITVAALLMLAYMIVLENSHNIRSILMLGLPIMFTNRGRALVFCCMLGMMIKGPVKNSQVNIGELHNSLDCCKSYLIVKTDKSIDENVVKKLARVEEVVMGLVDDIKGFANKLKDQFKAILQIAITVERYIMVAVEKLEEIVNICNTHTKDIYENCKDTFKYAYSDCRKKLGVANFLCEIVSPLDGLCELVKLPTTLCEIPQAVFQIIDRTIGQTLRNYMVVIENEFYVNINITRKYSFNETRSKSFDQAFKEIRVDVTHKFWYIHFIASLFNLVSLVLVVWILGTATLYHMHYLTDIKFDNMYIDSYLHELDNRRKDKDSKVKTTDTSLDLEDDQEVELLNKKQLKLLDTDSDRSSDTREEQQVGGEMPLFPLTRLHAAQYLKPFGVWMNEAEKHKLYIAGFVWFAIMAYIFFFVLVDYALYNLIKLIDSILKDILFSSELPIIEVTSKTDQNQLIRYNRTHLSHLRSMNKLSRVSQLNDTLGVGPDKRASSINVMYRRLMDSIERSIPDDVEILESLEQCLPRPSPPNFKHYENLGYLALFTFAVVILEAYALRTRHCIANLYFPIRARRRAAWLYAKMLKEKPKYENENESDVNKGKLDEGLKLLAGRVKR